MLEQSVPEGLQPMEGTHAGAVHEELQPNTFVFRFFPLRGSNDLCVCGPCSFFSEYKPPRFHGNNPSNSTVLVVPLKVN